MAEEKKAGKFLVYAGLVLILFLVLIPVVFSFSGRIIKLELAGMVFLILLSLIAFFGYTKHWGERVLFFVFLFSLGNAVLIWWFLGKLFVLLLFLSLVGFLMSLPKKEEGDGEGKNENKGSYNTMFEGVPAADKNINLPSQAAHQPSTTTVKAAEKEAKFDRDKGVIFSPGKYVASKMSNVYHEPKCDWAKRIVKSRQVWFKDEKDAKDKNYKAHSCVE